MKYSVVACFAFIILDSCFVLFAEPFFWVNSFIINFIHFSLSVALCIIFRLKKQKSEDQFMQFFEGENQFFTENDPEEIWKGDVKRMDVEKINMKPGQQWTVDMKLPKPPIIKKHKQRKNHHFDIIITSHQSKYPLETQNENTETDESMIEFSELADAQNIEDNENNDESL